MKRRQGNECNDVDGLETVLGFTLEIATTVLTVVIVAIARVVSFLFKRIMEWAFDRKCALPASGNGGGEKGNGDMMDGSRASNMYSAERRANDYLRTCVRDFTIIIDTCSLLDDNFGKFWSHLEPHLREMGKKILVPKKVYDEIARFADDPRKCEGKQPGFQHRAISVANNIAKWQHQFVEVVGDKNGNEDGIADHIICHTVAKYRIKSNILVITQDRALTGDIKTAAQFKSVKTSYKVLVRRVNHFGYLAVMKNDGPQPHSNVAAVTNVIGVVRVSSMPKTGDRVFEEQNGVRRAFSLGAVGPSGGEGIIYDTDRPDIVAKIYKRERLTLARFEKLKLMLSKRIACPGICFPMGLVLNGQGEFVGYTMKRVPKSAKELRSSVFIPQMLKQTFPDWKKTETVELCVTILRMLKYLHDHNIIVGDINPGNILVVSPTEVYFVDTDSYQVEGFPCPVGTVTFTPPPRSSVRSA